MNEEFCNKICSLERKEKEQEVYFLLNNHTFMTGEEMRKVYLLYFGYQLKSWSIRPPLLVICIYDGYISQIVYTHSNFCKKETSI